MKKIYLLLPGLLITITSFAQWNYVRLVPNNTDWQTTYGNGTLSYHLSTHKIKARVNGVTENLATESWVAANAVPDGDKGDITVSSGVWTIDNGVVSNAKLANSSMSFSVGTSGSNVNWSSSPVSLGSTATLNIPDAGASARGLVTTSAQTFAGKKTFTPTSTNSGFNWGQVSGNPSSIVSGDGWFDTNINWFKLGHASSAYMLTSHTSDMQSGSIQVANGPHVTIDFANLQYLGANKLSTPFIQLSSTPTNNNSLSQVLVRDPAASGDVKYRDASTFGPNFLEGTYTPTITNGANVSSTIAYVCQYFRIGNKVHVSGRVDVTPSVGSNTTTIIGISLPPGCSSNFTSDEQLGGTGFSVNIPTLPGAGIAADGTNDRATFVFAATSAGSEPRHFHFTYNVL